MDAVMAMDAGPKDSFMTLLRRHRIAAGMGQSDLAKRVGVTTNAVSLWELGKSNPKAKYIPKIARIFGMDPMDLTKLIFPERPAPGSNAP